MNRVLKRLWIPLVFIVVLSVSGLVVSRLHNVFGSEDPNANAGQGIEIVQFNPKVVTYEVLGPPGTVVSVNYWDAEANTHQIDGAVLPWSFTFSTTLPSVSPNIIVQGDSSEIGCRVTVDDIVRAEQYAQGNNAQTFCVVKSA